jgi:hypothetical protein
MNHKTLFSRRAILKGTAVVVAAPMINHSTTKYSRQAIDLIGRATVIDMLNVLTLDFNKQAKWFKDPETFTDSDQKPYLDCGISIIERMNKLGMAVDVSHCGDRTTLDAFEISKKPVLITPSNCRALVPGHPRLKTDEAIKKVGD